MGIFDRGAEVGTGRWHVRLRQPTLGMIEFADIQATSVQDATEKARAAFPGFLVEWAILEPNRYGVFFPGPQ